MTSSTQNPPQIALLHWYDANRTTRFSVGKVVPNGAAFDGANTWVTNYGSGNVSKLRTSDGAVLGTFAVGSFPEGVAFDGANIWVTNWVPRGSVRRLRASDGRVLGTFGVGNLPYAVAFDGANIWVANSGSNNVTKLRATDGTVSGTFPLVPSPRRGL